MRGGFHLGKDEEVFDAELHALYQEVKTSEGREEGIQQYTIFTGSTADIARARSDDTGASLLQSVPISAADHSGATTASRFGVSPAIWGSRETGPQVNGPRWLLRAHGMRC